MTEYYAESFLKKTAEHIYINYGDSIENLCIVLPNKRAALFLKKNLALYYKKAFWAPAIFSTEDFVKKLSGLQTIDNIQLLFEFYEVYKKSNSTPESFDSFSKWAVTLLHDFQEIDRYRIDAKKLFGYINEARAMEVWNLELSKPTEFQKNYLKFWESLGNYYTLLTEHLQSKNIAYQGLAFKKTADNIESYIAEITYDKILFVGFNAINASEEKIIDTLLKEKKAEVLWDVDAYYLNNANQEAGLFVRRFYEKWDKKSFKWVGNYLTTTEKHFTIVGVAQHVGQAKLAGQWIKEISKIDPTLTNTAIVLADENLLLPVLHALPEEVNYINITMGYPLKKIPLFDLFDSLFNLHENAYNLAKNKSKPYSFYYKDVLKVMQHPYIASLFEHHKKSKKLQQLIETIHTKNAIFFSLKNIESWYNDTDTFYIDYLFTNWNNQPKQAIESLTQLCEQLNHKYTNSKTDNSLELEYVFRFNTQLNQLKNYINDYEAIEDLKTLQQLFQQAIANETLDFFGEPLQGLQVMGMLETRTLDFENLIILSVNEEVLPAGRNDNSFIPYELKRNFKLPTYAEKDAIFAYHFYRLLQRAKNIYITYNTENDEFGSGEKSRFITQLLYELPKVNANVTISEKIFSLPIANSLQNESLSIKKDESIENLILKKACESGLSPSSLNTLKNCSLQFYFRYIAKIQESDEVEENIDAATLGDVIHKVVENFYTPFIGKNLNKEGLKNMLSEVDKAVKDNFLTHFDASDLDTGKNLLTVKVASQLIKTFINTEIDFCEELKEQNKTLLIRELEKEMNCEIEIADKKVKIIGKSDRIDQIGNLIRIIDYKSGKVEPNDLKVKDFEQLLNDKKYNKAFQLLIYAWLFNKTEAHPEQTFQSGIISFRKLSNGVMPVLWGKDNWEINEEVLTEFEDSLKTLLNDLLDTEKEFCQTNDLDICGYCDFARVCNR